MALRRAIGSLVVRSQAYYLSRASPSPPPSFSRPIIPCQSFAAPPQHVKKVTKDDADDAGPRINNDIIAPFLRLVADEGREWAMHSLTHSQESQLPFSHSPFTIQMMDMVCFSFAGHSVVPRHEALQIAARMGLDLVEVHRKTDPPVCKIMDFHKEKYNKDVKEKERLKTKSAIVLRGGDNKEVRHVKFATKKGGKKASKAMEDVGKGTPRNTASESPAAATNSRDETSEHGLEFEDVDRTPAYLSRESLAQKERQERGCGGGSNRDNIDNMNAGGNRINPGQGGSQSSKRGLGSRSENSHMEKREKTNDQDMPPEQANSEDVADDNSNSVAAFDSSPMELRVFCEVFSRLLAQAEAAGRHFMVATTSSYISSLQWRGH
ncbi:hypothetical protein ZWY2020_018322 [Hordeum vulgare]|nr:hypothetical protein ZWY2020_018322 [Hordeum vulgare]